HTTNVAVTSGNKLRTITHEGDDTLGSVALGEVQVVDWTSKEGIKLQGIATFPPGYTAGKKCPFLVLPHGGPEDNDRLNFDVVVRLIAAMGYVVLDPEYRGSNGDGGVFLYTI